MKTITQFRLAITICALLLISEKEVLAQGIFRCPLEETSGNHFKELFVINLVPFHVNDQGSIVDYFCTPYKTNIGIIATHFELVPSGREFVMTPIARVVAAASGQIIDKSNGYNDLACVGSSTNGNYITILHSNGMKTKYSFLRINSLTNKQIGDYVNEGEYLGYPGNQETWTGSNNNGAQYGSFAFEVRNNANVPIDPFDISDTVCFGHQRISLWKNTAYMDNKVWGSRMLAIELSTGLATDNCGNYMDKFNLHFNYGDTLDLIVKLANAKDSLLVNIFNPVGVPITSTLGKDFSFYFVQNRTAYIKFDIPLTGVSIIPGTYTVDCIWYDSFDGFQTIKQKMKHYFTVGCVADYTLTTFVGNERGTLAGNNIYSTQNCSSTSKVTYVAGNEIVLGPGFKALEGSDSFMWIESCTPMRAINPEFYSNLQENIVAYPNPANDFITVKIIDADSKTKFNIYNSTMQLIKEFSFENGIENKISTADLSPGIYFIDAQSENQSYKTKFVIGR